MGYPVRPGTGYIGWCSTGATNVVEPIDSKKAVGFGIGEQPASSFVNWLLQRQDEGLQYLTWLSSLDTVADEDFALSGDLEGNRQPTALAPWWYAFQQNDSSPFIDAGADEVLAFGPIGIREFRDFSIGSQGTSGYNELSKRVGQIAGRDFRAEFVYAFMTRTTGMPIELGFFYPSMYQTTTKGPVFGLMATGLTGPPGLHYTPSGAAGPTSVALSASLTSATAFYKWTVEARTPTMAVYCNDQLAAAVPFVRFGSSGYQLHFGFRAMGNSSLARGLIDRIALKVRRPVGGL
jgi:hypothetical protein